MLLSYITGVLENLGSQDSMEENFDVDDFVEMLEAYIPGFAEIEGLDLYLYKLTRVFEMLPVFLFFKGKLRKHNTKHFWWPRM